jgi:hypothetical protein
MPLLRVHVAGSSGTAEIIGSISIYCKTEGVDFVKKTVD